MNLSSTYILVPPPTISMGCPNRTVLELQRLIQYIMFAAKSLFWSDSPFQSLCLVYYTAPENKEKKKEKQQLPYQAMDDVYMRYIHPACVYPKVLEYQNKARAVS